MNKLNDDKRAMILRALAEGNSIRATARMTGTSKNTVSRLLRIVGAHCKNYHDRKVRGLECKQVQADEIWAFIGKKERKVPKNERGGEQGDCWTYTALCRDSKLLVSYRVAPRRDADQALAFTDDLADRLANRVQLTTDGHHMYYLAVELAFGWQRVDYAMLVKIYGASPDGQRRYSPAECLGTDKRHVMGGARLRHGLHVTRRASEPQHAHVHAPVHAVDERLLEEDRVSPVRRRTPRHAPQLLQAAHHAHERAGRD